VRVWGIILTGSTLAGLFLLARRAVASASPQPAPQAQSVPQPAPQAQPMPQTSKRSESSDPSTVFERFGRGKLSSGKGFTLAPLFDPEHSTWARLDYNQAERALARLGLRMPTFEELDEIANRTDAVILEPCTLVKTKDDSLKMGTLEFWERHDRCVADQIKARGWDGNAPLVSVGKHWALGADAAHSWLHGWYVPKSGGGYSRIIQNRGKTAHDRAQRDYSSTVIGVEV